MARANRGGNKSSQGRRQSAQRRAAQSGRRSGGQDSRKVHDTKGKNQHGRRKGGGGWGVLG